MRKEYRPRFGIMMHQCPEATFIKLDIENPALRLDTKYERIEFGQMTNEGFKLNIGFSYKISGDDNYQPGPIGILGVEGGYAPASIKSRLTLVLDDEIISDRRI